jgi:hypothetical protein
LPALALFASIVLAAALASRSAAPGLVGFACLGAGTALVVPTVFSAAGRIAGLAPSAGIATVSAFGWIGFVCGPPLIGQLAGAVGLRGALLALPAFILLVAIGTTQLAAPPARGEVARQA